MALSAFESYIVEVIAEAVARRIEKYIFTGTGTNQPGGVKTARKILCYDKHGIKKYPVFSLGGDFVKDRLKRVNRCIQEKGEVMLEELANAVPEVSAMTLRRDLEALEHSGEIVRIRGGARSVRSLSERLTKEERYSMRQLENTEGKRILAEKAVKYIRCV